ncbi:mitochondrial carrier protein [Lithospermum erythrorhizon]|uniref:Mitochondrial carrier protein n=1 Tax=Lithospermum erythrorhizon TaxID=34254 RepID=A0AAV3PWY7_LITER
MGGWKVQGLERKNDLKLFTNANDFQLGGQFSLMQNDSFLYPGGLFASIGEMGSNLGCDISPSPNSQDENKLPLVDMLMKYVTSPEENDGVRKKKNGFKLKIKVSNTSLRRLISGAIAGAVSRTAVAPLETIRTHLMVGSSGHSSSEVFQNIMNTEGWQGLFRGNFVNVIRVAPSKAIELFAYDTVNKKLSSKPGEPSKIPIPPALVAGACAGVSSTLVTYPLELLKTRLTIERGAYSSLLDAFVKILREGGPGELYRGLTPSIIGVIPYAATNYYAYDSLRKLYRKISKQERIGNIETLFIGAAAGAVSSTATFPLEVARKHMQVGAVSGREVYKNVLHALASIVEREGIQGLYKGLGPSCVKLVPAAGISFMCYEACKRILVEEGEEA